MPPPILLVDDNQELLRLLVQLFENAGYPVVSAQRGKQAEELARAQPPGLAVLDILLPDMTGHGLADQLRRRQPNLPLIFITGVFKAGRHALEARQKYAVLGYFEKPFDSQKLLETVARVIPPEKTPQTAVDEDPFDVELDVDYQDGAASDPLELTGRIKVTGQDHRTTEIAGRDLTARPISEAGVGPIRSPSDTPSGLALPLRSFSLKHRSGELKDNLPALITAFYIAKDTGALGVQRGKVKKLIYFEKGQPVYAISNLVSDRFGQFLVRVGKIKAEQLHQAISLAAAQKKRTGEILIEKGLLQPTERMYYVGQQVKAIIYTLFGWEDGRYVLNRSGRASTEPIKLDIHPAILIRRGIDKLYKAERLRALLRAQDRLVPSGQPAYQLDEIELEDWEAQLLSKVDGTRNVADLVALSRQPEMRVYSFLYSLIALTFLDRVN